MTSVNAVGSQEGAVSKVRLSHRPENREMLIRFLAHVRDFSHLRGVQPGFKTTPPLMHSLLGYVSPTLKRPEREGEHSPGSSVKVKNAYSYTSTPPIRLNGMCGNNVTFNCCRQWHLTVVRPYQTIAIRCVPCFLPTLDWGKRILHP